MKRGNWCPWSQWTPCSMTCGSQSRSRIKKCGCPKPADGSLVGCDDYSEKIGTELVKIDYGECQLYPFCPQNGGFSTWSDWTNCDCTNLSKKRQRLCNNPTPRLGGSPCHGESVEVAQCDPEECGKSCPENAIFTSCASCPNTCSSFSKVIGCESCTAGCQCKNNMVLNGQGQCVLPSECECSFVEKSMMKTVPAGKRVKIDCNECTCRSGKLHCTNRTCRVDGTWSNWSDWSKCRAAPCLLGYQWRTRVCTGTQNGGQGCSGVKTQQRQCRNDCPGDWGEWTDCSTDCGIGFRKRVKHWPTCAVKNNCPMERKPCQGQELVCAEKWTEWSNWTKCIGECGSEGQQYRSRHCHGTSCIERNEIDARSCSALCPGAVSEWSSWGRCSRDCDLGVKIRSRTCSSELCHEKLKEIEPCMIKSCMGNSTDENDTNSKACIGPMVYSKCISACTKRSCSDLSNQMPLSMCERCVPGCICPEGTIEEKGKCVKVDECECTDSTERQWAPGTV